MTTPKAPPISILQTYSNSLSQERKTGHATEHSYRSAFKTMLEALGGQDFQAINEPTHVEVGAPDFIVQKHGVPIGHVECKDIGDNLNSTENSGQLQRYRTGLPNLLLTDYLNWSQGGIYIFGVMKISLSDLVKTLLPYLYDDLVPTPDLRHMRISPWL